MLTVVAELNNPFWFTTFRTFFGFRIAVIPQTILPTLKGAVIIICAG
jgi:hypothetical protein